MYLLAVKSFVRFVAVDDIFVLDDGSLTATDKKILKKHIPHITIINVSKITNHYCPQGGCWERLLFISDMSSDKYVIQLDSDTVTLKSPVEVLLAIKNNCCFTQGTSTGKDVVDANQFSRKTRLTKADVYQKHIQTLSEANLDKIPTGFEKGHKYIRGCAGFAGFAKGVINREVVEQFSRTMKEIVSAERWGEWGSEQFTSNYLIANTSSPVVLPYVSYPSFGTAGYWQEVKDITSCKFIHFLGTYRFSKGQYRKISKTVITELLAP